MAHDAAGMALMEDPAERLGKIIRGVDDAGDVSHYNVTSFFPILDGKVLDVNVSGSLGRYFCVDHVDGRHIVFINGSRALL